MPSLQIRADHRQTQTLSPRLQHAVRLLQMSSLDFAALVRDALGSNPFLEAEEGEGDEAGDDLAGRARRDRLPLAQWSEFAAAAGEAEPVLDDGDNDRDLWQADGGSGLRHAEDGELSAMEMMAVETSLNTHLHSQLNVLPLSQRDLALARAASSSRSTTTATCARRWRNCSRWPSSTRRPSLQEMQIALKRVQSLEPAGVGARNVAECLRLQLPSIACPTMRALAQTIVDEHLQALAARDVVSMARQLGASPAQVESVCDRIRRLDPRPGWRLGSSQVAYVVPDVVVKKLRGQWTVQLNPAIVPRVRLNQVYAQLFQRHRTAQNAEMGAHLQEARWTLRNVEQRFSTILDVAEAIVKRQRNFLDYGPMAMKPMGLREIADEVGIHESTVSRVTNNKYMATPNGVFELKYFFSRAMISANGSACSGTAIRGLIKDIIEAETRRRAAVGCRDHAAAGAAGPDRGAAHRHQVPPDAEDRGGGTAPSPLLKRLGLRLATRALFSSTGGAGLGSCLVLFGLPLTPVRCKPSLLSRRSYLPVWMGTTRTGSALNDLNCANPGVGVLVHRVSRFHSNFEDELHVGEPSLDRTQSSPPVVQPRWAQRQHSVDQPGDRPHCTVQVGTPNCRAPCTRACIGRTPWRRRRRVTPAGTTAAHR